MPGKSASKPRGLRSYRRQCRRRHEESAAKLRLNEGVKPAANPHMWIPYRGPEPYDEVCHLCGVFSGAHHEKPDPPAAKLACPEPSPEWPDAELQGGGTPSS